MSRFVSKCFLAIGLIVAVIFMMPQPAIGQQSGQLNKQSESIKVSDQELESFVDLQEKLGAIQDTARQNMVAAIRDVGLDLNTYNKIAKQIKSAKSMDDINASKEQVQQVQNASGEVQQIQRNMRQKQQKAINEEEMSLQRFQEIRQAAMQNPKLLQRMQQLGPNK